jgi:hypothetical protein
MVIHEQSKGAVVLKELANNPLDAEVNEKLKKEIDDLKVKNTKIMEAYWKVAADALRLETEKLVLDLEKSRAKRCYTSEFGPEFDPEFGPDFFDPEFGPEFGQEFEQEFGNKYKTDYTHSNSLQDCYHNPGGATIYTKANAMNRMVFNPLLGIYEPGEYK